MVTAVLVTRGDQDMQPVLDSLPKEWPVVIWDNSQRMNPYYPTLSADCSVFGRYAALEEVETDIAYVQDDDVIVSDPQAIVDAWKPGRAVCNMPEEFRPHYPDSALVGFGACFAKTLPSLAFKDFGERHLMGRYYGDDPDKPATRGPYYNREFLRTCDVVFTTLTPRILVDVPKTDREFASDRGRMWKQPGHVEERTRMLELARRVRDA